jgi:hypothetical protein
MLSARALGTVFVELPPHTDHAIRLLDRIASLEGAADGKVCGLFTGGSLSREALAAKFSSMDFLESAPDRVLDSMASSATTPLVGYLPLGAAISRPAWEDIDSEGTIVLPWVPLAPLPEHGWEHSKAAGGWLAPTALLRRLPPRSGLPAFATLWKTFRSSGIQVRFLAPAAAAPGTPLPSRTPRERTEIAIHPNASVLALVPHYGCEPWLEQALTSLVEQTRPLDAIVVLDDASDEPPVDIVRRFQGVTLLRSTERSGPYRLVQTAIATTEYDAYLFQDADDWSSEDRLELLLREAERTGAELLGCQEIRVNEDTGSVHAIYYPLDVTRAHGIQPSYSLLHPSSLVARSLVDRVGGYATGLRFSGDTEFLFRAAHAARIVNIERSAYFRRKRAGSLTHAPETGFRSEARAAIHEQILERARENAARSLGGVAPDLTPLACVSDVVFEHLTGPALAKRRTPDA